MRSRFVDEIGFVWVPAYKKAAGYWRSFTRSTIARIYPPTKNSKTWLVVLGTPETNNGVYEGRQKDVWKKAVEWVKNPPPQPVAQTDDSGKKKNKKSKGWRFLQNAV